MVQASQVPFLTRDAVEAKAASVLREHGLYSLPVDPVVVAGRVGIKVLNAKFSDQGLAGMISKRGGSAQILIDRDDPPYRKRFTIAHELGHHFLHLLGDGDFVDTERDLFRGEVDVNSASIEEHRPEFQANWFASALLMPAELVRNEFENDKNLSFLARRFNVSERAMGIRLETLGLG